MARQVDVVNIMISMVRQGDGSYVTTIAGVDSSVCDPAGATQLDRQASTVSASVAWNGTDTCDTMATACLNAVKAQSGVA